MDYDFVIVGGGLVGSSVAYGLARQNYKVAVLDGGNRCFSASRGNFGLVWVQGKGRDCPPYARWSGFAANLWPEFDSRLLAETGIHTDYQRPGGMHFCLDENEWIERSEIMQAVQKHTGGLFEYEMLEHKEVKKRIPQISRSVVGASYSSLDGHVNPLHLLHALHKAMQQHKVAYFPNQVIDRIEAKHGGYLAHSNNQLTSGQKIVLCAGLQNQRLGEMLDMQIPLVADRGQVIITERLKPFLDLPTLHVRQTAEGTLQIGYSHEDAGLDDGTSPAVLKKIAQRAVMMFPFLSHVRLVRAWGALRIMTPDYNPIYERSKSHPGAFAISCHSGVTLAAAHAGPVSGWISGNSELPMIEHFTTRRFDVPGN